MRKLRFAVLGIVALLSLSVLLLRCDFGKGGYRLVEINGVESCHNYTKLPMLTLKEFGEEKRPLALVKDGDALLVGFGDGQSFPFLYRKEDGEELSFRMEPNRLLKDEKVVSLSIEEDEKILEWLDHATESDLRHVRAIAIGEKVDKTFIPRLNTVTSKMTQELLVLGSNLDVIEALDPKYLVLMGKHTEGESATVSGLNRLQYLVLDTGRANSLKFLESLENLKALVLYGWEPQKSGPLPEGLAGLRRLHIHGDLSHALAAIPRLDSLEEFEALDCDHEDVQAYSKHKSLTSICIGSDLSPDEYSALGSDLPRLEFILFDNIERVGGPAISFLQRTKRLKGVMIVEDRKESVPEDYYGLKELTDLDLLILPEKLAEAERIVAELKAALPRCRIISAGMCLGSGWILVLMAAIISYALVLHSRRYTSGEPVA